MLGFNFRFENILSTLESHVDERIASGSYDALKMHLVPFVQKLLGTKEFPERLILTAAGILDNNCFEISMPLRNVQIGGLFLTSLILCHSCVPNTRHFINYIEGAETDVHRYQMTFQTTGETAKSISIENDYSPHVVSSACQERRRSHDHLHKHSSHNTWTSSSLETNKNFRLWLRKM